MPMSCIQTTSIYRILQVNYYDNDQYLHSICQADSVRTENLLAIKVSIKRYSCSGHLKYLCDFSKAGKNF